MTHALKTWPLFYEAVIKGSKPFEVRKNDRPFKVGEILLLQEWDNVNQCYTGKECEREITYILPGGQFGIEESFVVMGLKERIDNNY